MAKPKFIRGRRSMGGAANRPTGKSFARIRQQSILSRKVLQQLRNS